MKGERMSSIKTLTVAALSLLLSVLPRAGGQCVALEFNSFQPADLLAPPIGSRSCPSLHSSSRILAVGKQNRNRHQRGCRLTAL